MPKLKLVTLKRFNKPHKSLDDQVQLLISRGMTVSDQNYAKQSLGVIGYYRLSSYWYHLEEVSEQDHAGRAHKFRHGANFNDVMALYVFDQKLRILMMEAIERLEIAIRAKWAHYLSETAGAHAHCESECFENQEEHMQSLASLLVDVTRAKQNSSEICHYLETYNHPMLPPIWTVVGCMSLGELLRWIRNTKDVTVKPLLAKDILGTQNIKLFDGIMRQLTTVRNMCAHHGRLWDQRFITRMPYIKDHMQTPMVEYRKHVSDPKQNVQEIADNKMYNTVLVVAHLMLRLSPASSWPSRLATLVSESLTADQAKIMGFPSNWEEIPFWVKQLN